MRRTLKIAGAVVVLLAVVIIVSNLMTRVPVETVQGGCYTGQLPGFGEVQLTLLLGGQYPTAWLYQEGVGSKGGYADVTSNSNSIVCVDVWSENFEATNAILAISLGRDKNHLAGTLQYKFDVTDTFDLTRRFEYRRIQRRSGFLVRRWGEAADACCEYPVLPGGTKFEEMLNRKIEDEARHGIRDNTGFNFEKQWDDLRYGAFPSEWDQKWQVRLLTNGLASFAVWQNSDPGGGSGNHSSWTGRNFWLHNGELRDIQITDLFQPGIDWWGTIRKYCQNDLAYRGYKMPSDALADPKITPDAFTLSPTGLQLYFNPYSIGSGAEGEFIVHVPYGQARRLMKPELAAILGLDQPPAKPALN